MSSKIIKSACRVFEVLEYFNTHHGSATVMDVARSLEYPQSSTSELLHCMVSLGYLSYSRLERTYRPSARVAVLGARDHSLLFGQDSLLVTLETLARNSGGRVVLAAVVGLSVREIYATAPAPSKPGPGTWPLLRSALGHLFLSTHPEAVVAKLVHRLNAEAEPEHRVVRTEIARAVDQVRARGYAAAHNQPHAGDGVLATLLPRAETEEQLALAISGPAANDASEWPRLLGLLRAAVAVHRQAAPTAPPAPRLVWPRDLSRDLAFDRTVQLRSRAAGCLASA